MTAFRALLTLSLAVALLATGIGAGMARGAMAADGQLCSVTGPAPVVMAHDGLPLFDAEGDPVTLDRDLCLDCLTAAADLPRHAGPDPVSLTPSPAQPCATLSDRAPAHVAPCGLARAPPRAA